jgi:hypothetical protein
MSWRQYGGTSKYDKMSNINVNTVSTDSFRLHGPYQGDFDICGNLFVDSSMVVFGSFNVKNNLLIGHDTIMMNDLTVNGNIYSNKNLFLTDGTFSGNLTVGQRTINIGDVTNKSSLYIYDKLYFDPSATEFFHGENNKLGLNVYHPKYTLDICGNIGSVLNVYSSQESTRNVIAQNNAFKGISVNANTSTSSIRFFNDSSLNVANMLYDGQLIYNKGGVMTIDVSSNTQVLSDMVISNRANTRSDLSFAQGAHIYNETVVLYDNSWGTYLPEHYKNNTEKTGYALTMVTADTSSNTFMNIVTPTKVGLSVGGGAYPNDQSRSMGTMGWVDTSGYFIPSQIMVSGNNVSKYRSSTGFNTYAPRTEQYVVDINGPVHITNGQIKVASEVQYQVYGVSKLRTYQKNVIAVGSPSVGGINTLITINYYSQYISYSNDGGQSWKQSLVNPLLGYNGDDIGEFVSNLYESSIHTNTSVYTYDNSFSILVANGGFMWYTINGGLNWSQYLGIPNYNFTSVFVDSSYVFAASDNSLCYFNTPYTNYPKDTNGNIISPMQPGPSISYGIDNNGGYTITTVYSPIRINSVHATNTSVFACGNGIVYLNRITIDSKIRLDLSYNVNSKSYNSIFALNNSVVAVGANIISYSNTGGLTNASWTDISLSNTTLNSVYIFDTSNAIAVGNNGVILFSNNSFANWNPVPQEILSSSGNASTLIDTSNNFTSITMSDADTFIISAVNQTYIYNTSGGIQNATQNGKSKLYYCFFPNLFNRVNNHVLDLCGNMRVSGDIRVENQIIGNDIVYLNKGLNSTSVSTGTLVVTGGVGVSGNMKINGNLNVSPNSYIESIGGGNINIGTNPILSGSTRYINIGSIFNNTPELPNSIINIGGMYDTLIYVSAPITMADGVATGLKNTNINGNLIITTPFNGVHSIRASFGNPNLDSTSTGTGVLVISGGVGIDANVFIGGNTSMGTYTYVMNSNTESTSISTGTLTVKGGVGITCNAYVGGNMIVSNITESISMSSGGLIVKGGAGINSNLYVGGNTTVSGNINILKGTESRSSSSGTLIVTGGVGISGNTNIGGNTNISANLYVDGNVKITKTTESTSFTSGGLIVQGGAGINANLYVGGNTVISGYVNVLKNIESVNYTTGTIVLTGGAGISANVFVGGNATVGGNIIILNNTESTSTSTGTLILMGGIGISSNVFVGGNVNILKGTESMSTNTGTLILTGGAGISSNVFIGGNLRIIDSTECKSTSTGSVVLAGGLAIAANTYIGGNIYTYKSAYVGYSSGFGSVESTSTSTGQLVVTGGTAITANVFVGGNVTILKGIESTSTSSGTLIVAGGTCISSNVYVGGNTVVNGNIRILNNTESTTTSSGTLIVSGGAGISANLFVGGAIFANNITESTSISSGSLIVKGGAGINSNLFVGGNVTILKGIESTSTSSGTLIVSGGACISSNTYVGGNTTVNGNVRILKGTESTTTSTGTLIVTGGAGISSNVYVGGNTTVSGNIIILNNTESTSTNTGTLIITGGAGISANVYVGGNTTVSGNVRILKGIESTSTSSGTLIVSGGASISANVYVGGNTTVSGNIRILNNTESTSTNTGTLIVTGGAGISSNVYVGGNATVNGIVTISKNTESISTNTGTLIITGGAAISSNVYVGGNINISKGTESTSTSTGTLIVSGGACISSNVYVGGNINVTQTGDSTSTSSGSLIVQGGVGIVKNGYFGGSVTVTGTINNNGGISGGGAISTSGLLSSSGGLTVSAGTTSVQALTNNGVITNTGSINNTGGISGGGAISTSGLLSSSGGLTVSSGATSVQALTNEGVLTNKGGISGAGTITSTGAITGLSINASSDYRIKENVVSLSDEFTVDDLNPVIYQTKKNKETHIGFIAHELQEHYPYLVNGEKDGEEIQSVNYIGLIGVLVKEIQTLKQQVKMLMKNETGMGIKKEEFAFVSGTSLEDVRR